MDGSNRNPKSSLAAFSETNVETMGGICHGIETFQRVSDKLGGAKWISQPKSHNPRGKSPVAAVIGSTKGRKLTPNL